MWFMVEKCEILCVDSVSNAVERIKGMMIRIGLSKLWLAKQGINQQEARSLVIKEVNKERLANNRRLLNNQVVCQIAESV